MNRLVLRSRVGADGVLHITVPMGELAANREVHVTIEVSPPAMTQEEWRKFVLETAGSWQGEFERPEQGDYEKREGLP